MVGVARGSSHLVHGKLQAPRQVRPLGGPSSGPAPQQRFTGWTFTSPYYQVRGPAGRAHRHTAEPRTIFLGCSLIFKYASIYLC